jgi:hypothetical protein
MATNKTITDLSFISSGSINSNTALVELVSVEQLINYKTTPENLVGSVFSNKSTLKNLTQSVIDNSPTSGQKAALVGTNGTPGVGNPYVTDSDPRLTGSTGSVSGATNIGTGEGQMYSSLVGSTLQFKTIKAGSNVTITNNTNDVTISSSGSTATGSAVILKSFILNETMAQGDLSVIMSNGNIRKIQYNNFGNEYIYNEADTDLNNMITMDINKFVVIYRDIVSGNNIAKVCNINGSSITFGSSSIFSNGTNTYISMASLDSTRFVLAYKPFGQTYGLVQIGTVEGTTIIFSSGSIFADGAANISRILVSSLDSSKVVVAYRNPNASNYSYAIIGTVTGTNIIYGSSSIIVSEASYPSALSSLSATSFVVSYRKTASDYEGDLKIGTISGTTITFGSAVTYDSVINTTSYFDNLATLNSLKFVITYADNGNSDRGTSKIGTISGTTITLGGATIFTTAATSGASNVVPGLPTSTFTDTKFVVGFVSGGSGSVRIGTVLGTGITYDNASSFNSSTYYLGADNLNTTSFIIVYTDLSNNGYGTALYAVGDPNLITDRISGILQASGSTGQSKPVSLFGENSTVHIGLIPGRLYYYNISTKNGVVGTSNDYLAGVALSTTELKIVSY